MPVQPPNITHPETRFQVPTTAAAGVASRNLETTFSAFRIPLPDNLLVDNTNGPTRLTLTVNGHQRIVAPGGTLEIREREVGRMTAYTVVPDAAITAGDVQVYERRIGNRGVA